MHSLQSSPGAGVLPQSDAMIGCAVKSEATRRSADASGAGGRTVGTVFGGTRSLFVIPLSFLTNMPIRHSDPASMPGCPEHGLHLFYIACMAIQEPCRYRSPMEMGEANANVRPAVWLWGRRRQCPRPIAKRVGAPDRPDPRPGQCKACRIGLLRRGARHAPDSAPANADRDP